MTTYITQANHPARWANVQIDCCPSIPWDVLQAPCDKVPTQRYEGHLPGSGVQRHSADFAFARHGIVMQAHEATGICGTRRLWLAYKGERMVFAHPHHDAALAGAVMLLTGA